MNFDVSERFFEPGDSEGRALLDDVVAFIRRYVVLTSEQGDAAALWVAHTWAFAAAEATPYLHVTSVEKESGKTQFLEALELVAVRPIKTGRTTAAALARAVAQEPPPTLLLDESDNAFRRDREYVAALLGVLNDGYRRGGKTMLCLPPKWELGFLSVFGPKAIAGIGELPDTVASRSIRLELKRRTRGESIERFRRRQVEAAADPLCARLAAFAEAHIDSLAQARPELPDQLGDRSQDVWEPLLAIADLAGNGWSERARRAALVLSKQIAPDDDSLGVRLLADIRRIFDVRGCDRLATSALIGALAADEEGPWADWHGSGPIPARALATILKPYGVRSRTIRLDGGETPKGFHREQFEDAWSRYLPSEGFIRHTATTHSGEAIGTTIAPPQVGPVAESNGDAKTRGYALVADVADTNPAPGDDGFRNLLDSAFDAGQLTRQERLERRVLHDRIVGTRSPAGEQATLCEIDALIADGVLRERKTET